MSALLQQTPEWHNLRKDKIGASDAPIIMGVSPWTTPYQLWLEKSCIEPGKEKNWAQNRGLELEAKARAKLEEMTGLCFAPEVVFHPDHSWMMASLDGMELGRKHIAEIKCPGFEDHSTALLGDIPDKYYPQLQHQLEVCGLDMVYYFSFDGENGVLIECKRDDKYIKNMLKKEKAFWDCVQDLTPPAMTDRDYRVKNDDLWEHSANQWIFINKQLKHLSDKEKELRDQLISMTQNKNSLGSGIKLTRILRKGAVEYNRIPEIENVNLEAYRKDPIETWRITEM